MIDKNMNKNDLRTRVKMGPNTLAKMGRNENVSMDVLTRICQELHCDIGDIVEVIPEERDDRND